MLVEQRGGAGAIGEVELDEFEALQLPQFSEPRLLETHVVIGRQTVDADDRPALLKQPARDVKADEAGRTGDKNRSFAHGRHSHHLSETPQLDALRLSPRSSSDFHVKHDAFAALEQPGHQRPAACRHTAREPPQE